MMEDDFDIREPRINDNEREYENALRPLTFDSFSGQDKVVENLKVFVMAARMRKEALDHVLLHGPPGLGKTTLSNILANELGVGFKVTSGPVLDKPGDLAGVLTSLEKNDVLFIDEIHRLSPVVEEYLYSAMEDYRIDIMIDKGPSARSIQLDLCPFTLVGATTRSGLLTSPLRARFGINMHLEYYDMDTLTKIILRSADILNVKCELNAAREISSRSRGTPRIANALLRRVRDFAQVKGNGNIDSDMRAFLGSSKLLLIPFFSFPLGAGMNLETIIKAGGPGILLGIIAAFTGVGAYILLRLFKEEPIIGLATGSTAGNAVATPAAVAAAPGRYFPPPDTRAARTLRSGCRPNRPDALRGYRRCARGR